MTVSLVGVGNVGMALATALVRAGRGAMLGSTEPRRHAARYLEPLARAWIHLAFHRGSGRGLAFEMLRRG